MSIVRVGLAETKDYADGWDAIFSGRKSKGGAKEKPATSSASKKKAKKAGKKKK